MTFFIYLAPPSLKLPVRIGPISILGFHLGYSSSKISPLMINNPDFQKSIYVNYFSRNKGQIFSLLILN